MCCTGKILWEDRYGVHDRYQAHGQNLDDGYLVDICRTSGGWGISGRLWISKAHPHSAIPHNNSYLISFFSSGYSGWKHFPPPRYPRPICLSVWVSAFLSYCVHIIFGFDPQREGEVWIQCLNSYCHTRFKSTKLLFTCICKLLIRPTSYVKFVLIRPYSCCL